MKNQKHADVSVSGVSLIGISGFSPSEYPTAKIIRLNHRKLLEETRLSSLPVRHQDALHDDSCAACNRRMPEQQNALDDLNICADCLRIFAVVDQALNVRADRKVINQKRELMLKKWGKI